MPAVRGGPSGLVIPVPQVESLVGRWRAIYDWSAAEGMPPHVTVLFPFLPADELNPTLLDDMRAIVGAMPRPRITFAACGRFPDVLYLRPEPDDEIRALTGRLAARWPECPPYGGVFDEITPHLTVAVSKDQELLDGIGEEVAAGLPVSIEPAAATLFVPDDGRWLRHAEMAFA